VQVPNRILLTVLLLVLTTYQMHAAQVHAAQKVSARPVVDMAPNGVPIVQIAPPNAAGLSYNRFDSFEVDSIGLIINNSRSDRADYDSQLAGSIQGNPRLQHESAMVILNEVTGSAPSQLRGPIEIAGDKGYGYKADLIIVNPNGLVIDGARFINIARMTLSTGRPTFNDNGDLQWPGLQTLNVIGGDIIIERGGLDARGADSVDLYAQALQLNGKLYAHTLSLRLGSQSIDYRSGVAKSNEAPNQRQMLLDSSELGGMYADRITLVGSGAGLGVRLPPKVVTLPGEIQISVEGKIYDYPNPVGGLTAVDDDDTELADQETDAPPLDELLREGAKRLIYQAVKAEFETLLAKPANRRTEDGKAYTYSENNVRADANDGQPDIDALVIKDLETLGEIDADADADADASWYATCCPPVETRVDIHKSDYAPPGTAGHGEPEPRHQIDDVLQAVDRILGGTLMPL